MFPVLFSVGKFGVSSFGLFLGLAFLFGVFLIWRLSRAWDLDEEKILDLTLLTFGGGLIGARIYFGIEHFDIFSSNPLRLILVNKFPGFSFWGAFLGGWLSLYFFAKRKRIDFWQVADVASVGFLGSLILADIGCLLGGCSIGIVSNFLAVPMVGVIGKRFPVQALEAILFLISLKIIWWQATHFHFRGKIVILTLILVGLIKFFTEPLRAIHSGGYIFSLTLVILGVSIFYKLHSGKRTPLSDFHSFISLLRSFLTDGGARKIMVDHLKRNWYNQKTSLYWKLKSVTKILRRFRVRFSHKQSKVY
ncbi:prolipoprotein diacylglyceryl transferase [Candidatus Microgenomates bacterium]|nr:prolipoprotein diacylglyceryl transferase [Candidatus Microgenomates bacterium]